MADQSRHGHEVQLAVADDLIGDIHAVALDVPRLGCGGIAINRAHTPLLPQPGLGYRAADAKRGIVAGTGASHRQPSRARTRPSSARAQPLVQGQVHAVGLATAYKLIEAAQTC
jgi:hypothetical protein